MYREFGLESQQPPMNMPPEYLGGTEKIVGKEMAAEQKEEQLLLKMKSMLLDNNVVKKERYKTSPQETQVTTNPERATELVGIVLELLQSPNDVAHRRKQLEAILDLALLPWAKKAEDLFANLDDLPEWLKQAVGSSKSGKWLLIKEYSQLLMAGDNASNSESYQDENKQKAENRRRLASVSIPEFSWYLYEQTDERSYWGISKDQLAGRDWVFINCGNDLYMRAIDYDNLHNGYDEIARLSTESQ